MVEPIMTGSFSGHETFPFRYSWLKKGFDESLENGRIFSQDDAMIKLGVGKNMVRSIRHWCLAAGILREDTDATSAGHHLRPTDLGMALFADEGWDPYLEDSAALWLIHWQICSNRRRATTWYWAFSHVHEPEFTKESLLAQLTRWVETTGIKRLSPESLQRDIDCLIRTYVPSRQGLSEEALDCPLVELGLIRHAGSARALRFQRGNQRTLPDGILASATLDYWDRSAAGSQTISLHDLAHQPGSPGRIFKIDEGSLSARYEQIEEVTDKRITYDETAGLKQLYRRAEIDAMDLLRRTFTKPIAKDA
jgi:hypothetical protein